MSRVRNLGVKRSKTKAQQQAAKLRKEQNDLALRQPGAGQTTQTKEKE